MAIRLLRGLQVPLRVTVLLEEIRRPFEQSVDETARIFITRIEDLGTIGTLFGKVYLNTDRRRATFQHSILSPDVAATEAALLSQFRAAYGQAPDRALYVLSNLLSTREHWEGSPLVRAILFGEVAPTEEDGGRITKAGALIRAVMDQWPEALRVLPDVGVDELDQIAGHATGPITTDPPQPAITEISEELTDEVTSAINAMHNLGFRPFAGAAQEAGGPAVTRDGEALASGADTELLQPAETQATQVQPRALDSVSVRAADTLENERGYGGDALPLGATQDQDRSDEGWGRRLVIAVTLTSLFIACVAGTILFLRFWTSPERHPSERIPVNPEPVSPPIETVTVQAPQDAPPPSEAPPLGPNNDSSLPPDEPSPEAPPAESTQGTRCFVDGDRDGFGGVEEVPSGEPCRGKRRAQQGGDCDDSRRWVHPGAKEFCDSIDNDCDDKIDDELADANKNGKYDCREGKEKWKGMNLIDRSLWRQDFIQLALDPGGSTCSAYMVNWQFTKGSGDIRSARVPAVGGQVTCTLPFRTADGSVFDGGSGPRCGDKTFNEAEQAGKIAVWWQCCFEREAAVATGEMELDCGDYTSPKSEFSWNMNRQSTDRK